MRKTNVLKEPEPIVKIVKKAPVKNTKARELLTILQKLGGKVKISLLEKKAGDLTYEALPKLIADNVVRLE